MKSLKEARIIEKEKFDKSNRYKINLDYISIDGQFFTKKKKKNCMVFETSQCNNDSFFHRGLSKTGYLLILNLKAGEWISIKELKEYTCLAYNTIKAKLDLLASMEYVINDGKVRGKKYQLIKPLDDQELKRIALLLDMTGQKDKQAEKIMKERETWNNSEKNPENKKKAALVNLKKDCSSTVTNIAKEALAQ